MTDVREQVWKRALDGGVRMPCDGDRALAALLEAHSLLTGHGPTETAEIMGQRAWDEALSAYRHFRLNRAADFLAECGDGSHDQAAASRYRALVPGYGPLRRAFEKHYDTDPEAYAPPVEDPPRSAEPERGRGRAGTLAIVVILLAALGAGGAWAVAWYGERAGAERLAELTTRFDPERAPGLLAYDLTQMSRPWQQFVPLQPPEQIDYETDPAWYAVERHASKDDRSKLPGRGVLVSFAEPNTLSVDRAQLGLAAVLKAEQPDDVAWYGVLRRTVIKDAYRYSTAWVDVERIDLQLIDSETGGRLAAGSAEAIPPKSVRGVQRLYRMKDEHISELVRRALAAARQPAP